MRILQVHNRHATHGGADEVIDDEAEMLRNAGHVVDRYLHASGADAGGGTIGNGVRAVWNLRACRELDRVIAAFKPDVAHVHTPFPLLSPAIFRTVSRCGVPVVTTVHSYRYSCIAGTCLRNSKPCEDCIGHTWKTAGIKHRCYHGSATASSALTLSLGLHRVLGTFAHDVDRFITLTEFSRNLLIRDGMSPGKVVVKPNSVRDPGIPNRREGNVSYALFAGRLVEEKGVGALLEAWEAVGNRLPLRIAGDGSMRGAVERASRANPAIQFLGWLGADELDAQLAGAEFVVVPSEWYEEPLTLIQSLAAGRPLIVSDLENTSETVRAASAGISFQSGNSGALAVAVGTALSDVDALRAMGERGRRAYEQRFTRKKSLSALENIYDAVIAERRR